MLIHYIYPSFDPYPGTPHQRRCVFAFYTGRGHDDPDGSGCLAFIPEHVQTQLLAFAHRFNGRGGRLDCRHFPTMHHVPEMDPDPDVRFIEFHWSCTSGMAYCMPCAHGTTEVSTVLTPRIAGSAQWAQLRKALPRGLR